MKSATGSPRNGDTTLNAISMFSSRKNEHAEQQNVLMVVQMTAVVVPRSSTREYARVTSSE